MTPNLALKQQHESWKAVRARISAKDYNAALARQIAERRKQEEERRKAEIGKTTIYKLPIGPTNKLTIPLIVAWTCAQFDVSEAQINSKSRDRYICFVRHVAMYRCRYLLNKSLPEIGRKIGGRDHTTVLHAVDRIETLLNQGKVNSDFEFTNGFSLKQTYKFQRKIIVDMSGLIKGRAE